MYRRMIPYIAVLLTSVIPCHAFSQDNAAAAQPDAIAQATESVKKAITSLAPSFQACYLGTIKDKTNIDKTNIPKIYIKYHLEYDENGEVYFVETSTDNKKIDPQIHKCFTETIPGSFNLNLPEDIKQKISEYPDDVQKFGKLSFSHNVRTKETVITSSQPIGTKHKLQVPDRHYLKYQKRKSANKAQTQIDNSAASALGSDIADIINRQVYESVIAAAPEINKCYTKIKAKYPRFYPLCYGPCGGKEEKNFKYYITYDEYGTVYDFYGAYYNGAGNEEYGLMDKCVKKAIPEKFDIDFSETVKDYPQDIQKYGRFELMFNIDSKKVTINQSHSAPIGSRITDKKRYRLWQQWINKRKPVGQDKP